MRFELFDNKFLKDFFTSDTIAPSILKEGFLNNHYFKVDIKEEENNYLLFMDVPGLTKEDIKISYEDEYLTISSEKENKSETDEEGYIRKERLFGKTMRRFFVGDIDEKEIIAKCTAGVLTVHIPKEKKTLKKSNLINIDWKE